MSNILNHILSPKDLRQLKQADLPQLAKELREFLVQLKGRSPREMLGLVAQSSLVQSVVTASILTVMLVLVLTAVPFALSRMNAEEQKAEDVATSTPGPTETGAAKSAPATAASTTAQPAASSAADVKPAAPKAGLEDALGIGETLNAPADVNPLQSAADDLFKDLE